MQELKIQRKDLRDDMVLLDGFDAFFSLPKHKKGYSGVGVYTRNATCAPTKAEEGVLGVLPGPGGTRYCDLPSDAAIGGYPTAAQVESLGVDPEALDAEGRCVVLEFPAFVLLGVYSPANSNGLRDDFRYGFICALDCRIRNLVQEGKRVVLVGDLNVSRDELDTASAAEDCRKAGITHEEYVSTPNRRIFNQLLVDGEVIGERDPGREAGVLWDTCRAFHPGRKGMYTHWEQKINARPGNYGSRIDFVLVDSCMRHWIKAADIQEGLLGSDHCPVYIDFDDEIELHGEKLLFVDIMSPPGVFHGGRRRLEWKVGDVPAFSAKRMPEFEKRRSIKSMFMQRSESSAGENSADQQDTENKAGVLVDEKKYETTSPGDSVKGSSAVTDGTPKLSQASSKRRLIDSAASRDSKKQRPDNGPISVKDQKSLKGFFTTANKKSPLQPSPEDLTGKTMRDTVAINPVRSESQTTSPANTITVACEGDELLAESVSSTVAAAEANQRSWSALFSKPVAPLCEGHDEPCKTMLTKKKGVNEGRSFWMCARPLGPSGEKERGTEWRCGTFIWATDWRAG